MENIQGIKKEDIAPHVTPLCEIAFKYGTDKCPQFCHPYTPVYYELFRDRRESVKKVLELGIGHYKNMRHVDSVYDWRLNRHYQRGASLKMWRDFFPNAQVYGVDIEPETMFADDRIQTFLCDERKGSHWLRVLRKTGRDIDLFVDDGSHNKNAQIHTCRMLMPLLKKDVTYVIEDVRRPLEVVARLSSLYRCEEPKLLYYIKKHRDCLIIVRNK